MTDFKVASTSGQECVKVAPMKQLFVLIFLSCEFLSSYQVMAAPLAEEYDFIKPYNEKKSKLKKLPPKPISKTLFCSQMNLLVDQAPTVDHNRQDLKADRIVISKTRHKLYLFSQHSLISEYPVAFGFGALDGAKSQSGDGRTPEGLFHINLKNPESNYHKALQISYPEEADQKFADKNKVKPGGLIMIHGYPRKAIDGLDPVLIPTIHPNVDWTQGCIAVSNPEIEEIYDLVDVDVDVEICPLLPEPLEEPLVPAALPQIEHSNLDLNPEAL